jgi:D-tyrosyl-tRNA(Tyr) deacylase
VRFLLQRVSRAEVAVDGRVKGRIGTGLLVLVGIGAKDTDAVFATAIDKISGIRLFPDEKHPINRSVADVGGGILLVSQFTLFADCRKGRRPSFTDAMPPAEARAMMERFVAAFRAAYTAGPVETGEFGAHMDVTLTNDGPVTVWLDSEELGW